MAIQRVDGYVYSCAPCGAVYPRRPRRGQAVQDELDHHRAVSGDACRCQVIADHRHHTTVCSVSHQRAAVLPSGTGSTGVTL